MPKDVVKGSQSEQDEWCFAYAATWPDVVREVKNSVTREDVTKYNRGIWHYVDIPIYLNDEEQRQLEHQVNQNVSREIPENRDDPTMNVIQAEKNAAKYVGDASADKEQRAVSLCWLVHLVGDSHQPLHSTALFTTHRFRDGDHGGNFLAPDYAYKTFQGGYTLHSFWDDAISTDEPYAPVGFWRTTWSRIRSWRRRAKRQRRSSTSAIGSMRAMSCASSMSTRPR